jgi:hypothetical protein
MQALDIPDLGEVGVYRSDCDGRWVVQIDTQPTADADPDIRVFVNDGLVFGNPKPWAIGLPASGSVVPYATEEAARADRVLLRLDRDGEWVVA